MSTETKLDRINKLADDLTNQAIKQFNDGLIDAKAYMHLKTHIQHRRNEMIEAIQPIIKMSDERVSEAFDNLAESLMSAS